MINAPIFVSYAHEDVGWMKRLQLQLTIIENAWNLHSDRVPIKAINWVDIQQLPPGANVEKFIANGINSAIAAIIFVSSNYLDSKFINGFEMPRIQERGLRLFPLLIEDCNWKIFPWSNKLVAMAKKPLSTLNENEVTAELEAFALQIDRFLEENYLATRRPRPEWASVNKDLEDVMERVLTLYQITGKPPTVHSICKARRRLTKASSPLKELKEKSVHALIKMGWLGTIEERIILTDLCRRNWPLLHVYDLNRLIATIMNAHHVRSEFEVGETDGKRKFIAPWLTCYRCTQRFDIVGEVNVTKDKTVTAEVLNRGFYRGEGRREEYMDPLSEIHGAKVGPILARPVSGDDKSIVIKVESRSEGSNMGEFSYHENILLMCLLAELEGVYGAARDWIEQRYKDVEWEKFEENSSMTTDSIPILGS